MGSKIVYIDSDGKAWNTTGIRCRGNIEKLLAKNKKIVVDWCIKNRVLCKNINKYKVKLVGDGNELYVFPAIKRVMKHINNKTKYGHIDGSITAFLDKFFNINKS